VISLFGGVLLGIFILQDFSATATFVETLSLYTSLLEEGWILKTLAFAILVGSVMELLERSGGIDAFVNAVTERSSLVNSPRSALLVSYIIGVVIFIESSITSLIAGAVGRPLCDKEGVAHAKLAFVCDSTSAPISSLILLNGWGALLLGLIATQVESAVIQRDALELLIESVAYNFYALVTLAVTFIAVWFGIDIGPMRRAKASPKREKLTHSNKSSMIYMLLPIGVMIGSLFLFLYLSGNGDILKGSGSTSIFYTMLTTIAFMFVLYIPTKQMDLSSFLKALIIGAKKLFPIAIVLLFAFAIGKVTTELHTGLYLASLSSDILSPYLFAATIFLLSSLISFSTGTSWGTFSIMIPIALPMALGVDAKIALAVGAVISGGVFGDHCSPISDTTIISSLAADCDVVEHVQTQLPYALISAFVALLLFIAAAFII